MKNVVTVLGLMLFLVACGDKKEFSGNPIAVSYTHLTLPTILRV